jgi:spermidine/putrescine transport system substrate-binding protein
VNTTDPEELKACAQKLQVQKSIVQQYVMDQVYDSMINGEAAIAPYYAGDCMQMINENPDLAFYLPENQGFNMFIDSMCIPSCAQEKDAAETFINFLCDPEISGANMDYICYASPIMGATDHMDEELATSPVIYPEESVLSNGSSYSYLPEETTRLVEELFMKVRNGQ